MSLAKRIIPKLDIKGENLVKGVNLEGLRVLGKPEIFAKNYYKNGADELIYQDIISSLYGISSLENVIRKTASEIFIPLTVGGGIKTISDISRLLRCGADKISMNSAVILNPGFIHKSAQTFGSSTIVVSIETQFIDGDYYAFTDCGRNRSNKKLISWIKEIQELGAGEIIITFIDSEGTGKGIDLNIVKKIIEHVKVPLILNGGIGKKEDAHELLSFKEISGLAISSMFHYKLIESIDFTNLDFSIGNIDFIKKYTANSKIDTLSILELKKNLLKKKIDINI